MRNAFASGDVVFPCTLIVPGDVQKRSSIGSVDKWFTYRIWVLTLVITLAWDYGAVVFQNWICLLGWLPAS